MHAIISLSPNLDQPFVLSLKYISLKPIKISGLRYQALSHRLSNIRIRIRERKHRSRHSFRINFFHSLDIIDKLLLLHPVVRWVQGHEQKEDPFAFLLVHSFSHILFFLSGEERFHQAGLWLWDLAVEEGGRAVVKEGFCAVAFVWVEAGWSLEGVWFFSSETVSVGWAPGAEILALSDLLISAGFSGVYFLGLSVEPGCPESLLHSIWADGRDQKLVLTLLETVIDLVRTV